MKVDILKYKDRLIFQRSEKMELLIYARLKKKWLVCTPEEICRQCLIYFLEETWGLSVKRMIQEKTIRDRGRRSLRVDLIVYDDAKTPFLMAEVKAPHVSLDMSTFLQAIHYAQIQTTKYLLLTNGIICALWEYDSKRRSFVPLSIFPGSV